jgi:hypothetical protein
MADSKKKSKPGKLVFTGALNGAGAITGKGALTLTVSDATKASVSVDAKPGSTYVTLASSVGLKIRKSSTVKFNGKIAKDLNRSGVHGDVGVQMKLPKGVDVSVSHRFRPDDDVTSLKLTIRF